MTGTKAWYESKGMWGGIVTILVLIAGFFGYDIAPEDQKELVMQLTTLGGTVAAIVATVGRYIAKQRIR